MTGTCEGRWVPVSWLRAWTPQRTRSIRCCPWVRGRSQGLGSADAPLQDTGDTVLRPPADLGGGASSSLTPPCSSPLSSVKAWRSGHGRASVLTWGPRGAQAQLSPAPWLVADPLLESG